VNSKPSAIATTAAAPMPTMTMRMIQRVSALAFLNAVTARDGRIVPSAASRWCSSDDSS
jgi:hypothetical protein